MILRRSVLAATASLFLLVPSMFASVRTHRHTSTHPIVRRSASAHVSHPGHFAEHASYSGISTERATEIQSALISRGYLTGEPTGSWDATSIAAMQKLQSDNGWQTKFMPDSRALIKLGLGANSPAPSAGVPANSAATVPSSAVPAS